MIVNGFISAVSIRRRSTFLTRAYDWYFKYNRKEAFVTELDFLKFRYPI